MVDVVTPALLSCLNSSPATPPAKQEIWDVFQTLHQRTLSNSEMKEFLIGEGYTLTLDKTEDGQNELVFCKSENGISLLLEQEGITYLARNTTYAAYAHQTDQNYSAHLAIMMVKWRQDQLPEPFDDDEGWDTVAWSADDDSSQVGFSVGHNKEYGVTKIWGHQIHIGTE